MDNLDAKCQSVLQHQPKAAIAWYLMASYLYYKKDISLLSDAFYDYLASTMLRNWGWFVDHPHAHLITPDSLRAGTLYSLTEEDYPTMTKDSAMMLAKELKT